MVCLTEGTFALTNEVSLSVDDVTIRGAGADKTILDFSGQGVGANGIAITGDGCVVEDLQVKDTPGDGIRAQGVEGIVFRRVRVMWTAEQQSSNGAYGLYPVQASKVLVEDCVVSGASDAGIYVGQSTQILVRGSEAFGNVAGIEIENSSDAEVTGCHAHDNSGGILVFNLPELPVKNGMRTLVHGNTIENNNIPNFGKAGSVVSLVPGGSGAFLLACDHNEFRDNIVRGNSSAGLLLISYLPPLMGEYDDAEYDKYAESNYIHDNTFENNGTMPQGVLVDIGLMAGPDILTDGCRGDGVPVGGMNCIREAEGVTLRDIDLWWLRQPQRGSGPYDCTLAALPGQDF
ncbi:MAG: parallel beta-helix domain-containing protein [bacterium]